MIRIYHRRTTHTLGYATLAQALALCAQYPEYNYEVPT